MLLALSKGNPRWAEPELNWKSKVILLLGFSAKCPKLSGINQAKACLKELALQRV